MLEVIVYEVLQKPYLSGLKSFVTIDPGSMTRVSLGRSVFAKVCLSLALIHVLNLSIMELTVASWFSPIFLPTSF
jgi:hypothetical protein